MISVENRASLQPGRVRLDPVNGQPNMYDMERADEPQQAGTPLNRRTMQLLQADLRTYPVAAGQGVTAGDVVDVVGGEVTKAGTPSQCIALQSATAGQPCEVIFDGVAQLPGAVAGREINSPGVYGYCPQDGWVWVRPEWDAPSEIFVTGFFETKNSSSATISLGFTPKAVFVIGRQGRYMSPQLSVTGADAIALTIIPNGFVFFEHDASENPVRYIAFR